MTNKKVYDAINAFTAALQVSEEWWQGKDQKFLMEVNCKKFKEIFGNNLNEALQLIAAYVTKPESNEDEDYPAINFLE